MSVIAATTAVRPRHTMTRGALARPDRWLLCILGAALLISLLPLLLASCCAPPGASGLGTIWFINDFAQYESAMRQGAEQPGWLVYDAFTAEPHQPALMFPLYVGIGKLSAATHFAPAALERLTEIVARVALVLSVWYFARAFARSPGSARWAILLTLFASGFELLGAALSGYAGNWSYETNAFGLLFAAPHVPLAMAGTLLLAARYLRPTASLTPLELLCAAAVGAAIALLHPFHLPALLVALLVTGAAFWRTGRGARNLAAALAIFLGALPVLASTFVTFSFDQFWLQTYTSQNRLPSPAPHELLVDLGPTLLLALGGGWFLRSRVAPFGLLIWLLIAVAAMYAPVPYQRRLGFGVQPALAILAANTLVVWCTSLVANRAALVRLGVVAATASGTVLILASVVAAGLSNAPLQVYRSTPDLDAAANWLGPRTTAHDVILADWDASNYLAARTSARAYGGHPVATLHAEEKRFVIASVFAHPSSLLVAHSLGATWLVYGPRDGNLPVGAAPAFVSGDVRVYRLVGD